MFVALIRQKDRNEAIKKDFEVKGTNFSLMSDLSKLLSHLREKMISERRRLKFEYLTLIYRISDRSYKPKLQKGDFLLKEQLK